MGKAGELSVTFDYGGTYYGGYRLAAVPRVGEFVHMYGEDCEDTKPVFWGRVISVSWSFALNDNDSEVTVEIEVP
ncbi:MAG: hypothetical protein WC977_11520 [Anaerovoracaceae bacterium]